MLKKSQNIIITIVILLSIPIITMGVASIYSDGANLKTIATQFLIDGIVGINTTGPDRKLDILDASNPQLRLTHTDGSVYVDMQGTSDGHLSISGSGGNVGIATTTPNQKLTVVGNISGTGELAIDGAVSFGSTLSVTATSTQATTTMTQAEANQLTVAGLTTLFSSITTVSTTTQLCLAGDDCILTWGDVAGSADIDTANVTSTNSLVATGYTILNTLVVDGLSALTTMTVTDATSTNFDVSTQLHSLGTLIVDGISTLVDVVVSTSLQIPNAANPTVNAIGELAYDTTDGTLQIYDGTAERVIGHDVYQSNFTIYADDDWDSETVPIWQAPKDMAVTLVHVTTALMGTAPWLTFNIEERAEGSLSSAGTDIFAADVMIGSTSTDSTSFSNAGIAVQAHLVLTTAATAELGTVDLITGVVYYRKNVE